MDKKLTTITIPKTEFTRLQRQAKAYRTLAASVIRFVVNDPITDVVDSFKHTDLYTDAFLKDLESGLRKSTYAHKTASKRS